MKFKGRRQSKNVEDRRGSSMPVGIGGLGVGGLVLVILFTLLSGGDVGNVLQQVSPLSQQEQTPYVASAEEQELYEFSSVVLADTEDVWHGEFEEMNRSYHEPKMVIFQDATQSGCGLASEQVGPFYCPVDQTIYLDLDFYRDLQDKLGAKGMYSFAYVIAHEVGHHVQNELGIIDQVNQVKSRSSEAQANRWSVATELQADYLAGVVSKKLEESGYLDVGDIQSAISATEAIGDDVLQTRAQGYAVPDSFTHGSSEQRTQWFLKGYEAGDISQWDTFSALGLQ